MFPVSVAAVAARQKVTPAEALDRLCRDARLAVAAEKIALSPVAGATRRAVLARALLREIQQSVSQPASREELDAIRKAHWYELDHPDAFRALHAVALGPASDVAARSRARDVANRILRAVATATSDEDFTAKAREVDHEGIEIRIEPLPPVTSDGRVLSAEAEEFDKGFAAGVSQLRKPGDISGVVESSFGYHVIRLTELIPAAHAPDDELRRMASNEIVTGRARKQLDQTLAILRQREPIEIERSFEQVVTRLDRRGP